MSGPMQWSSEAGALVPATGFLPSAKGIASSNVPSNEPLDDDEDAAPSIAMTPRRQAHAKAKAPRAVNVVQLAKSRLRDVKRDLRRMKALEKERAQLERLIDAADGKPRAVVRDIKRTAG